MGLRSWIAVVATAVTVALTGWAVPADAVGVSIQYCTGNGTTIDHDVPGTLVVESYSWCSLVDITVHGSVVVASNAEAICSGRRYTATSRCRPSASSRPGPLRR